MHGDGRWPIAVVVRGWAPPAPSLADVLAEVQRLEHEHAQRKLAVEKRRRKEEQELAEAKTAKVPVILLDRDY